MVAISLCNRLPRDMVQIQLNNRRDLLYNPLYFLPGTKIRLRNFENIDHTIRKDNLIDLKVNILMPKCLNLTNVSFYTHILEDIYCKVYYLGLLELHFLGIVL